MNDPVERAYPHLARWVTTHGWIELGQTEQSRSFVRALDEGGLVREGDETYAMVDDALRTAELGLAKWMRDEFGEH